MGGSKLGIWRTRSPFANLVIEAFERIMVPRETYHPDEPHEIATWSGADARFRGIQGLTVHANALQAIVEAQKVGQGKIRAAIEGAQLDVQHLVQKFTGQFRLFDVLPNDRQASDASADCVDLFKIPVTQVSRSKH